MLNKAMLTSNYSSYLYRLIHHQAITPFLSFTITRLRLFRHDIHGSAVSSSFLKLAGLPEQLRHTVVPIADYR